MDDNFSIVKGAVSISDVWNQYGDGPVKHGFVICPFHKEKTASMRLYDRRYKCFGCNASGDVFDLTSELLGITAKESLEQLAKDFGITISSLGPTALEIAQRRRQRDLREARVKQQNNAIRTLCEYHRVLFHAKNSPDHPLFDEALMEIEKVNYLIDEFQDNPDSVLSNWQKYIDCVSVRFGNG